MTASEFRFLCVHEPYTHELKELKLRQFVQDEKLPHVALGESVWRFDIADLDKFIESRRQLGA